MTEMLKKKKEKIVYISYILLTLRTSTLQNGQTHSNFLKAVFHSQRIVRVCLTILWGCRLKGRQQYATHKFQFFLFCSRHLGENVTVKKF